MNSRFWIGLYGIVGVIFTGLIIIQLIPKLQSGFSIGTITELILLGSASAGLLYWPYWHARNPLPSERYRRITGWTLGSALFLVAFSMIVIFVGSGPLQASQTVETVLFTGAYGVSAGLLLGTFEAEGMTNAEIRARADALEEERQRLLELNDLLRHYILNSVTIIIGYSSRLRNVVSGPDTNNLDIIEHRAQTLDTLATNLRTLTVDAVEEQHQHVEACKLLREAFDNLERQENLTITFPDTPRPIVVPENSGAAIELLLDSLIRATHDGGQITIRCESPSESKARVVFECQPASLPPAVKESVFEPTAADIGLQLYIAHEVLTQNGDLTYSAVGDDILRFEWVCPNSQEEDGGIASPNPLPIDLPRKRLSRT
ncbi:MAG: hypothetical protein ABEI52_02325 [Halobacteriaceae archaeon]